MKKQLTFWPAPAVAFLMTFLMVLEGGGVALADNYGRLPDGSVSAQMIIDRSWEITEPGRSGDDEEKRKIAADLVESLIAGRILDQIEILVADGDLPWANEYRTRLEAYDRAAEELHELIFNGREGWACEACADWYITANERHARNLEPILRDLVKVRNDQGITAREPEPLDVPFPPSWIEDLSYDESEDEDSLFNRYLRNLKAREKKYGTGLPAGEE